MADVSVPPLKMIGSVSGASGAYSVNSQLRPAMERFGSPHPRAEEEQEKAPQTAESKEAAAQNETANPRGLSPEEARQVEELKRRDAEVRAHEMAHLAAAGSLAMGGANYVYQTGPDGRPYAIGGDVQIDTSPGRTPEETLRKSQQIRAAALAPSDPSPQDLKVAAAASAMAAEAQRKMGEPEESDDADPSRSAFSPAIKRAARAYEQSSNGAPSSQEAPFFRASA